MSSNLAAHLHFLGHSALSENSRYPLPFYLQLLQTPPLRVRDTPNRRHDPRHHPGAALHVSHHGTPQPPASPPPRPQKPTPRYQLTPFAVCQKSR
ncbi:hypothetical protein BU26DRAFT_245185 [Trematosphaeria pertusa]|uniref:Uncharacterized protein n=1 Tax=Trematosphaeria pertusa TaxID=390896 RepID=A0A6A6IMP8_9PLEO|nr:uncharacterized protein BU26DRAFT_245185 [Trematosphaeria pertusa]KAF2251824.1 hypothetical protein BU26DRAFT_245185 [Trematosphaeria pertusa]